MDVSRFWLGSAAAGGGGDPGDPIGQSLRFRGSSALHRDIGTDTVSGDYTVSFWMKPGDPNNRNALFSFGNNYGTGGTGPTIDFDFPNADGILRIYPVSASSSASDSTAVYRDFSAWYHIVYINETGVGTRVFVNGQESINTTSVTAASGNSTMAIGNIANTDATAIRFDGYMADWYFIDGQVLEPTVFGRENNQGVWVPVAYDGDDEDYGDLGFHLDFADREQIGRDVSGNDNHFSNQGFNFDLPATADFDLMDDSPTQNWAVMNPLVTYEGQIGEFGGNRSTGQRGAADGNLTLNGLSAPGGGQKYGISTHAARGRVYLELTIGTEINGGHGIALFVGEQPRQDETYYGDPNVYTFMDNGDVSQGNGSLNGTTVIASFDALSEGDVASIALDMDNGNAWFAVNGVWQEGDPEAGTDPTLTDLNTDQDYAFLGINCGSTPDNPNINYGQQDTFTHTPPAGFEALQTQNMPAATIANGRDHFGVLTYTGNGAGQTIGTAFVPDLIWFKTRTAGNNHLLVDSVRGGDRGLFSNEADPETTSNQYVTDFDNNGSIVTGNATEINDDLQQQVAWYWRAGGAAVANNDGSIASQVSANTDAGFSIVTYTGTDTAGATIGHGLSQLPECIFVKNRDESAGRSWAVYHVGIDDTAPEDFRLGLNLNTARVDTIDTWNDTAPTNTVFSVGASSLTNATDDFVAYCWHSIPGYSAFGSYDGNSDADGPFIYTGFRPAFVMVKRTNANGSWMMFDSTRSPNNPCGARLAADLANDEADATYLDLVSNGFKLRESGSAYNSTGGDYIYCCFAENPTGSSNTSPATAR